MILLLVKFVTMASEMILRIIFEWKYVWSIVHISGLENGMCLSRITTATTETLKYVSSNLYRLYPNTVVYSSQCSCCTSIILVWLLSEKFQKCYSKTFETAKIKPWVSAIDKYTGVLCIRLWSLLLNSLPRVTHVIPLLNEDKYSCQTISRK